MEQIINFGISEKTIVLILMLPVAATFIAFCRQIIGIRGFGIYIASIAAFAFVETQLKYGIVIFLVVLIAGTLMRFLVRNIRILYMPRMAIVLTGVSFSVFLMFILGSYLKIEGLQVISIFPILITILLVERFVADQIERGQRMAIYMTIETLILAIISYYLINWVWLEKILLLHPLLLLLVFLIFDFLLGKQTGFRLTEYFRFQELMEYLGIKEKNRKEIEK